MTRQKTLPLAATLAVLALVHLAMPSPGAAAPETFTIDPTHSEVTFQVRHMMVSNVRGRFEDFGGTIVMDETNPENSSVAFTVMWRTWKVTLPVIFVAGLVAVLAGTLRVNKGK